MKDFANFIPASNALRIKARIQDVLLMFVLGFMIYKFSSRGDFLHSKRLIFCFVSFFYLLLYCPIMDKTGGTIGKRTFGISVISVVPIGSKITLLQAYKRVFTLAWVLIIALVLQILVHYGYYDVSRGVNEDGEPVLSSAMVGWGYMITFIGLGLPITNGNPEEKVEVKREPPLYGYETKVFNKGQAQHDEKAKTAVITSWKEKGLSISEFNYK